MLPQQNISLLCDNHLVSRNILDWDVGRLLAAGGSVARVRIDLGEVL